MRKAASGGATVLTRTLHHDRMQRLRGTVTKNASGVALSSHGYTLDDAGRRKTAARENGQRWDYGYDTLGQVTSAVKRFPNDTAIPGHTFGYAFDGIGNRTSAINGGAGTAVTYTPNALNQYTAINTEGGRFILGEAPAADAVTVNSLTAARAGGLGFYWKQITGNNSASPLWSNDSVVSNSVTITGKTWTPQASVTPVHDADGNLTYDGRWNYTWDAESRKTRMETTIAAYLAGAPRQQLDFVYDSQGRRVSKALSTWNGTIYAFTCNTRFLYDGWNLIAEYSTTDADPNTLTLQATHTWGIDLSGTPQGAGGVGGLLSSTLISQSPISNVPCFPAYDGNSNISAWIAGDGTLLGRKDYSPFGQLIAQYKFTAAGDTTLSRLAFGFSTKYTDAESGLLYYGYRYYDPVAGRWPSRDPIEEEGGVNLYGFAGNSGIDEIDLLGLTFPPLDIDTKIGLFDYYSKPGPFYPGRYYPNLPSGIKFSDEIKEYINKIPGCTHCGSNETNPRGYPTVEHQPPRSLSPGPYNGYRHCPGCQHVQWRILGMNRNGELYKMSGVRSSFNRTMNNTADKASGVVLGFAMATEAAYNWTQDMLINRGKEMVDQALAQCRQQKESKGDKACGCCTIWMLQQYEFPSRKKLWHFKGESPYWPAYGNIWTIKATGTYRSGNCDGSSDRVSFWPNGFSPLDSKQITRSFAF